MKLAWITLIGLVLALGSCDEPPVGEESAVAGAEKEEAVLSLEELIDREVESLRVRSETLDQELPKCDAAAAEQRGLRAELEMVETRIDEIESKIDPLLRAEKVAKELNKGLAKVIERSGLEPDYDSSGELYRNYELVRTLERELWRWKKENEELRGQLAEGD